MPVKEVEIDIVSEIPAGEILDDITSTAGQQAVAKELIDSHRARADVVARSVGGQVRTDWKPGWYIRRGSHLIIGGDWILAASRWKVWVPNSFEPQRAAGKTGVM